MKDEEMAEEYAIKSYGNDAFTQAHMPHMIEPVRMYLKQGFLAGLKAGRPQWHDLRKDPNDLPDTDRDVWVKRESEIECRVDNYYEDGKGWGIMFREGYCSDDVILWCELPVPPKESE